MLLHNNVRMAHPFKNEKMNRRVVSDEKQIQGAYRRKNNLD